MPKLWTETIETHRREVRDAILSTTAALVADRGLRSVTMSQIAQTAGIGRATLYKYFPDVPTILAEWHAHQVSGHLHQLADVRERATNPVEGLQAVLEAYALIVHDYHDNELAPLLHGGDHVARAEDHLHTFVRDLIAEGARAGVVRDDVAADELARYSLHALAAAGSLPSKAAVRRLVNVVMSGLSPRSGRG